MTSIRLTWVDLFTTERTASDNLQREGVPAERIQFVGNVMIDTLLRQCEVARESDVLQRLGHAPTVSDGRSVRVEPP